MKLKTENIKKVKEHLKGYTPKGYIKDFPIEVFEKYPNGLQLEEEPMRYFYITYKIESKDFFYCGCFTYTSEIHPTLKELKQRAKEISKCEETPIIDSSIHEFKSKEDYENFIK